MQPTETPKTPKNIKQLYTLNFAYFPFLLFQVIALGAVHQSEFTDFNDTMNEVAITLAIAGGIFLSAFVISKILLKVGKNPDSILVASLSLNIILSLLYMI